MTNESTYEYVTDPEATAFQDGFEAALKMIRESAEALKEDTPMPRPEVARTEA